jgi:hypothetical protein
VYYHSIVQYIEKDVRTFSAKFLTETCTTTEDIFYKGVSLGIQKMPRRAPNTHSMYVLYICYYVIKSE